MVKKHQIFYQIKHSKIEIYLMWFTFVATIVLLLCLIVSNNQDIYETKRIIESL